jgi:hypothetical protein
MMNSLLSFCLGAAVVAAASPALALSMTLSCEFSGYGEVGAKSIFSGVVPEHSTHRISDNAVENVATSVKGYGLVDGREIRLEYRDRLHNALELEIDYKINRATGRATVRTRAFRQTYTGMDPRRSGLALITGSCRAI